jgi:hypothetical protein
MRIVQPGDGDRYNYEQAKQQQNRNKRATGACAPPPPPVKNPGLSQYRDPCATDVMSTDGAVIVTNNAFGSFVVQQSSYELSLRQEALEQALLRRRVIQEASGIEVANCTVNGIEFHRIGIYQENVPVAFPLPVHARIINGRWWA